MADEKVPVKPPKEKHPQAAARTGEQQGAFENLQKIKTSIDALKQDYSKAKFATEELSGFKVGDYAIVMQKGKQEKSRVVRAVSAQLDGYYYQFYDDKGHLFFAHESTVVSAI